MKTLSKLLQIFLDIPEFIKITHNKIGEKSLRNKHIPIQDVLLYRFLYTILSKIMISSK